KYRCGNLANAQFMQSNREANPSKLLGVSSGKNRQANTIYSKENEKNPAWHLWILRVPHCTYV
ncbi:hypothetical protein ILYODFUR_014741, partial [Ilyodon furcidens]